MSEQDTKPETPDADAALDEITALYVQAGSMPGNITIHQAPEPKYAKVEIFGHRVFFGRVTEIWLYGATALLIEEPLDPDFAKVREHRYGGAAIFSLRYITREEALDGAGKRHWPLGWEKPAPAAPAAEGDAND